MHIAIKVGNHAALAIIPAHCIILDDLNTALVGISRRLHQLVKGTSTHFDMTLLGHKIDASKAQTEDAKNVVYVLACVLSYAEFAGYDHISLYVVDNLMGYVETAEKRLHTAYCDTMVGIGITRMFDEENRRLLRVKDAIVLGVDQPAIYW